MNDAGILSRLKRLWQPRGASTSSPGNWLVDWFRSGSGTHSGVRVDAQRALTHAAVWACVRLKAESLATLPLKLYRENGDGGKSEARDTPLWSLLHRRPNRYQNAHEFKFFMQACLELWGNAYAQKIYTGSTLTELRPFTPNSVRVERDGYDLRYIVRIDDTREIELNRDSMLHIRQMNLAEDGLLGMSTLASHRESFGGALARNDHGNTFFGNGAIPSGVITFPGRMTEEQILEKRRSWNKAHQGLGNSSQVAVLDQGQEYHHIGIPNEDSQWLESRSFDVADIARIFGVPGPLINDHEHSSFNNVEQLSLNWRIYGIRPMAAMWQAALDDQCLLTPTQRNSLHFEFVIEDLLSADLESKVAYLTSLQFSGVMSRNEVRSKLNLNPVEGGDRFYMQTAMSPISEDGSLTMDDTMPVADADSEQQKRIAEIVQKVYLGVGKVLTPEEARRLVTDAGFDLSEPFTADSVLDRLDQVTTGGEEPNALSLLMSEQIEKLCQIECDRISRAAGKDGNFIEWLSDFKATHADAMLTKLSSYAQLMRVPESALKSCIDEHLDETFQALLSVAGSSTKDTLKAQVAETVSQWPSERSKTLQNRLQSFSLEA